MRRRCEILSGWNDAGRKGFVIGHVVHVGGIWWVPVVWDGEKDPDWHKMDGLSFEERAW